MKLFAPRIGSIVLLIAVLIALTKLLPFISHNSAEEKRAAEFRLCGIEDLPDQLRSVRSNKFVVVIVGDGVKDKTLAKTRPYSSNYAQGWDLYEGVAHAATKPTFKDISDLVELVYVDDGGESRCAELISKEIIQSPKVIAVIGHASTGTTKIALENYKKANLPTIIPIATNPTLTFGCKNCFRLPSNDAAQARAISDYAVNILNGRNIYLVWDDSESAKDYSEFLQSEVVNLIGSKIKFRQPVTFRPMNYEYLLKSISYNNTDVIIFCGYGSMAREFLNGLRFEYLGKEQMLSRPKVIMSDGSKIADIKEVSSIFGFETYVAFPSAKWASKNQFSDFHPETPPLGQEKMKEEESYELFGYDSLILFSDAFKKLNRNISRQRLNDALAQQETSTTDLCYRYKFVDGENVDDRYFVYSVASDAVVQEYDEAYLTDVFTDKPMPELLAEHEQVGSTEDVKNLQTILERDSRTKALIVISTEKDAKDTTSQALQVITEMLQGWNRSLVARITVAVGIGPKRKLQLWVIPADATARRPPENYRTYNAEELIDHKQVKY